ncbi:MAG: hypothetical protein ACOZCO_05745 [Bacteroidota bacterium]
MNFIYEGNLENVLNPVVFTDSAKLYEWPDSTSKVISFLRKNENILLVKQGYQSKTVKTDSVTHYITKAWYKIETGNCSGYMMADDICRYTLSAVNSYYRYFVKTDPGDKHNPGNGFTIYSYDTKKRKYIDTLHHEGMSGGCVVKQLSEVKLLNTDIVFSVTRIWPYCGGGTAHVFFVASNDSVSELITGKAVGEMGEYEIAGVWLPVTLNENKIKLMSNGDVNAAYDSLNGKIIEKIPPKNISVPVSQLIIVEKETATIKFDENGNAIQDEKGEYESVKTNSTEYYKWDGKKLVEMKNKR